MTPSALASAASVLSCHHEKIVRPPEAIHDCTRVEHPAGSPLPGTSITSRLNPPASKRVAKSLSVATATVNPSAVSARVTGAGAVNES